MKSLKIFLLSLFLAGCSHVSQTPQEQGVKDLSTDAQQEEGGVDYTLELGNFYYEPNIIEAKAGSTIRIKLVNVEGTHDFDLDELGVESSRLRAGEEEILEFEVPTDSAGKTYEFYCSIGSHRELGMVGSFVVTE